MTAPTDSTPGRPRLRIALGAVVVIVIVALSSAVLFSAIAPRGTERTISRSAAPVPDAPLVTTSPSAAQSIFIHVVGRVSHPGIYELRTGARGVDAIAAAGGFEPRADRSAVNLARVLVDGEQLVVPKKGEAPTGTSDPGSTIGSPNGVSIVNINTADTAALESLPRVGPAMAARIIEWRDTNGKFSSVDDLGSVTGIGPKTLEAIRPLVTV